MDKNIKNVVFDLGGVLLNLDLQRTIDAFKEAGFEDVEKQIRAFNITVHLNIIFFQRKTTHFLFTRFI